MPGLMGSGPGVEVKVVGYVARLADVLRQCANDVDDRPDAFLWGARRSLEAMMLAIHAKDPAAKSNIDTSVGHLLEQPEKKGVLIDHNVRGALPTLQTEGNIGTHVQSHEPMDYQQP